MVNRDGRAFFFCLLAEQESQELNCRKQRNTFELVKLPGKVAVLTWGCGKAGGRGEHMGLACLAAPDHAEVPVPASPIQKAYS